MRRFNTEPATRARVLLARRRLQHPDVTAGARMWMLAFDLSLGQRTKMDRLYHLPLFRIAQGDNIDEAVKDQPA